VSKLQQLLWVPPGKGTVRISFAPLKRQRPEAVWTLPRFRSESVSPTLPYSPVHLQGAFLEDFPHDWKVSVGPSEATLSYSSGTIPDRGVWLLLEWE